MNPTRRLEISLMGLATSVVPLQLRALAEGIKNGTRPFVKDEVVEQLNAAANVVEALNTGLLELFQETE